MHFKKCWTDFSPTNLISNIKISKYIELWANRENMTKSAKIRQNVCKFWQCWIHVGNIWQTISKHVGKRLPILRKFWVWSGAELDSKGAEVCKSCRTQKSCKLMIISEKSSLIQPRTSPPKYLPSLNRYTTGLRRPREDDRARGAARPTSGCTRQANKNSTGVSPGKIPMRSGAGRRQRPLLSGESVGSSAHVTFVYLQ